MYDKKYNCYHCHGQYKGSSKREKILEALQEQKGCFDESQDRFRYKFENIGYRYCIGNYYDRSVSLLNDMFNKFQQGVMPFPGSYSDQPGKILDVFQLIESTHQSEKLRLQKEDEAESRRKSRMKNG